VIRLVRRGWRRLISMRTALILLFLLAIAAVPGSLLPQKPLNPTKTASYIASHGAWGTFLDRLGLFDVFASPWFAAIYLLLFISLVGCLIPRIRVHARAMRAQPLPAPKRLDRLPESGAFQTSASPAEFAAAARTQLGRRWRVVRREDGQTITLSAEKGYSRETGNLIFHVALLVALVAIAVGRLYSYEGSRVLREGHAFCNQFSQYDTSRLGRFAQEGKVSPAPFCLTLNKFTADYTADGEPSNFAAAVNYGPATADHAHADTIKVNHPLRLQGDRVYLISHGFSPTVTIHLPDGSTRTDTADFIPSDPSTLLSEGAFQEFGKGTGNDLGIEGLFAPNAIAQGGGAIGPTSIVTSASPQPANPMLAITIYTGNAGATTHSVYSLDKTNLKQIGTANLAIGQTVTLAGGVTVTFDGFSQWAGLQISHDPSQYYLLIAAAAMVLGLIGSLSIRRRRLWIKIAPASLPAGPSPTVVTVGGLARSDSGNFSDEFAGWLERLKACGPPVEPARERVAAGKD
jgi:cytochrome c biogenesis protein